MKRTKIVATLGLSSNSKEKIKKLIKAGMNMSRINFSHGDHNSNGKIIRYVKELRAELGIPVGIIADLQGPRIRTIVDEEFEIEKGEEILVVDGIKYEKIDKRYQHLKTIHLDWPKITKAVKPGNHILIEDGLLKIKVIKKGKNCLVCKVIDGGTVKNHKGVNIPDATLKIGAITEKDIEDLKFILEEGVDFIALSFVSNAKEIAATRKKIIKILKRKTHLPQIIAKIERKEAIENISKIIKEANAIMVARGDLGIEMDENKVVIFQKEIISECLRTATPVIVATQMLNSMIENPRPTRAEVSDVSNAVIDHADAVMLSGETANGKYPVEAVTIMSDIIKNTELSPFDDLSHGFLGDKKSSASAAIAHSAHELLKDTGSRAIVVASMSGYTARMISRHRPESSIYVMTNNEKTHNQLSLLWGVKSFVLPDCQTMDELINKSIKTIKENHLMNVGEKVIVVTGRPHSAKEHMSLIKIEEIK